MKGGNGDLQGLTEARAMNIIRQQTGRQPDTLEVMEMSDVILEGIYNNID